MEKGKISLICLCVRGKRPRIPFGKEEEVAAVEKFPSSVENCGLASASEREAKSCVWSDCKSAGEFTRERERVGAKECKRTKGNNTEKVVDLPDSPWSERAVGWERKQRVKFCGVEKILNEGTRPVC